VPFSPFMDILLVEDEPWLAGQISRALLHSGHSVLTAGDGPSALEAVSGKSFDLLLLDADLPGTDGFEVIDRVRRSGPSARVLVLTGGNLAGLADRADGHLSKPFTMDELVARIGALAAPAGSSAGPVLRVGPLCMDVAKRRVQRGDERIALSPREFEMLQVFMLEPGRTFSRDELCKRIWARDHEYDTRTVEVFIMRLRKKLDLSRSESVIGTVRGVGYLMRSPE
jgi:DNA-binding response OmpR family regulator